MEINIDLHAAFDQFTYYTVYTHELVQGRNLAINIRHFGGLSHINTAEFKDYR
jgi:hypothetical protein